MKKPNLLSFGLGSAKLDPFTATFSLPAGYTCPGAQDCLARAKMGSDGKVHVTSGPKTVFRCYAATMEARHPSVYKSRRHNLELL